MKKIFLTLVFVASMATVNANTSTVNDIVENAEEYFDCIQKAWDYGTENGGGNKNLEYILTDFYYSMFCEDLE